MRVWLLAAVLFVMFRPVRCLCIWWLLSDIVITSPAKRDLVTLFIQLTLVISTSLISKDRLSRSENLVPT